MKKLELIAYYAKWGVDVKGLSHAVLTRLKFFEDKQMAQDMETPLISESDGLIVVLEQMQNKFKSLPPSERTYMLDTVLAVMQDTVKVIVNQERAEDLARVQPKQLKRKRSVVKNDDDKAQVMLADFHNMTADQRAAFLAHVQSQPVKLKLATDEGKKVV